MLRAENAKNEPKQSPPSRAAWIEIRFVKSRMMSARCRRLHGRRGLKSVAALHLDEQPTSPPSRAAWIEMVFVLFGSTERAVAAFTGGVD